MSEVPQEGHEARRLTRAPSKPGLATRAKSALETARRGVSRKLESFDLNDVPQVREWFRRRVKSLRARRAGDTSAPPPIDESASLSTLFDDLAAREAALREREAAVIQREKALARRELDLLVLEKKLREGLDDPDIKDLAKLAAKQDEEKVSRASGASKFADWVGKKCRAMYHQNDTFYEAHILYFDEISEKFTVQFQRGTVQNNTDPHDVQLEEP